ncbi:Beta-galactosidase, partial [Pyrenophora tritici-repentis]
GLEDMLSSSFFNIIFSVLLPIMRYIPKFNHTNVVTNRLYSYMDVAGYNYGDIRYPLDAKLHPSRMMLGTETCPPDLPKIWANVEKIPNLIGDFMWTGWDYLGEVGIGVHDYEASRFTPVKLYKPWPHIVGGCGALDITGVPNASAFVAQACWKILSQPVIAVRPLDISNSYYKATPWRNSDAIEGWGWKGCEGQKAYIEVITQEEETELFLNGRSLGRASSNQANRYTARFSTAYEPGELLAVAYSGGQERSRSTLRSANVASVKIANEKSGELVADRQDLAYLELQLADQDGNIEMNDDDTLTVE